MSRLGLETIILTEPLISRLGVSPLRITIPEGVFEDVTITNTLNTVPIADVFPVSNAVITTDATPTTLLTVAIPTSGVKLLIVEIILASGTGSVGAYKQSCKVVNNAGTLTLGAPFDVSQNLDVALATTSATFVVSTTNIIVRVIGVIATTINWRGSLITRSTTF